MKELSYTKYSLIFTWSRNWSHNFQIISFWSTYNYMPISIVPCILQNNSESIFEIYKPNVYQPMISYFYYVQFLPYFILQYLFFFFYLMFLIIGSHIIFISILGRLNRSLQPSTCNASFILFSNVLSYLLF